VGKMTLKIKIVLIPQFISVPLQNKSQRFRLPHKKKTAFGVGGWGAPMSSNQSRPVPTENIHCQPMQFHFHMMQLLLQTVWRGHIVYICLCNQIYRVFVVKTSPRSCYTHLTMILKSAFHLLTYG